jgi:hypothetical protein
VNYYLNVLFFFLLAMDLIWLAAITMNDKRKDAGSLPVSACKNCVKPNIYLIVLDEYAGRQELTDLFKFDNSAFENELARRGFHVGRNTTSNYNFTPFSMASLFSMDYLTGVSTKSNDIDNRRICYRAINDNVVINTLEGFGYNFANLSIFDFAGRPSPFKYGDEHLNGKTIITSQTFTERIRKEMSYHLITTFKLDWALKNFGDNFRSSIQSQYQNTLQLAGAPATKPHFVYTHFFMPHYPYVYDKDGNELPFNLSMAQDRKDLYLGFLQYANKLSLSLIDGIIQKDQTNPIILLISDHGFNKDNSAAGRLYNFSNIINLRIPGSSPSDFPDSLSNVNIFRLLFNKQFNQQFSLLKDSTILLREY